MRWYNALAVIWGIVVIGFFMVLSQGGPSFYAAHVTDPSYSLEWLKLWGPLIGVPWLLLRFIDLMIRG